MRIAHSHIYTYKMHDEVNAKITRPHRCDDQMGKCCIGHDGFLGHIQK